MERTQIRKIKSTRLSVSGIYVFQGHTPIQFESTLERDFLTRFEFEPNILDITSQPCSIPFKHPNGRTYNYTPDFLVYYKLGNESYEEYPKPILVEVKPKKILMENWRKWSNKYKAAISYAKQEGLTFRLYDESRIHNQMFKNTKFLQRYERMYFCSQETNSILDSVRNMGHTNISYLLAKHFSVKTKAEGLSLIWHLISIKMLSCDMNQVFNQLTTVWISNPDE